MNGCPSLQQLERLLEEQLAEAECRIVSHHVSSCGDCQAALDRLTRDTVLIDGSASSVRELRAAHADLPAGDARATFLDRLKQTPPQSGLFSPENGQRRGFSRRREREANEPRFVGDYEILSELGRGGMAVVYKARHKDLHRLVALKMILAGSHAAPRDLARFREEAQAVARLHHPNIVQIYDIGESDGQPFFALEFLEEGSLVQRLRGNPQPLAPSAQLVETLAQAIHFAHQHHVVHRDLKPANILLQKEGGNKEEGERATSDSSLLLAPASFTPKIADFGLAKRLDELSSRTQSGEVVGTPSYMAPEQAAGKALRIGPATDVYALGAMLYELLTGRPPFKGATALDTVVQVLHEEPVRPRFLRPDLPRDLETICLKCLAKDPARRYASAEALADDLRRFRHGTPIHARPVRPLERAWKWGRRRPLTAALLVGMILVALLGFAGITWQWQEATKARDAALAEKRDKEIQRQQAEQARADAVAAQRNEAEARKRARTSLYYSRIAQSQLRWRVNDFVNAQASLAKCVPLPGQGDHRGWEWYYLQGLFHTDLFTLSHPHGGPGGSVSLPANGRRIASVVGGHVPGEATGGEVRIWDSGNGELVRAWAGPSKLHRLVFRPDGNRLALATTDGVLLIWDADTGRELVHRIYHTGMVADLAFSPDGQRLASVGWDRTVKIWNAETGEVLHEFRGHKERIQSVAFHPSGRLLASGSWDGTVKLWDTVSPQEVQTLSGHKSAVYGVTFSPDGRLLVSAGSNGNLKIWELATKRVIQSVTGDTGAVLSVAFSPDGRYLAYGGGDATVRLWNVEAGLQQICFRGHTAPVESVHFSPDGRRLVSFSPSEAAVKVWDLTRHPEYATFARTGKDVEALAFYGDGRRLVSLTIGRKLQTWDGATGVLLHEQPLDVNDEVIGPAVPAAFGPAGRLLAARTRNDPRLVKSWDVATGAEAVSFRGHALPVQCVRFSADGRRLVTCACDTRSRQKPQEIKVWDAATGEELAALSGRGQVFNVAFTPDGRWLALGGQDGAVCLLDWQARRRILKIGHHESDVTGIAFSPNGQLLASAGFDDRTVNVWKADGPTPGGTPDWTVVHTLAAPNLLCDLAFSPDGKRLVGISRDVVKMWEVETGQEVLTLRGAPQRHWDPPFNPRVVFSPDGKRLLGTNWDESISSWDAEFRTDRDEDLAHRTRRRQAADERALFWHLQEAEHCLEHKNLSAAVFHFERLGDDPLPDTLQTRKDRLAARLDKAREPH